MTRTQLTIRCTVGSVQWRRQVYSWPLLAPWPGFRELSCGRMNLAHIQIRAVDLRAKAEGKIAVLGLKCRNMHIYRISRSLRQVHVSSIPSCSSACTIPLLTHYEGSIPVQNGSARRVHGPRERSACDCPHDGRTGLGKYDSAEWAAAMHVGSWHSSASCVCEPTAVSALRWRASILYGSSRFNLGARPSFLVHLEYIR